MIDLKKAFETISHNILFNKLENYGIGGLLLDWVKSYLKGQQQFGWVVTTLDIWTYLWCPPGVGIGPKMVYPAAISMTCKVLKLVNLRMTQIFWGHEKTLNKWKQLQTRKLKK